MKELDIEENIIDDEEILATIEYDKLSDKAKADTIKNVYNNCKTIKDKLELLIELQVMLTSTKIKTGLVDNNLLVTLKTLNNKFTADYVENGSDEQRKEVFEAIGENIAKTQIKLGKDKERFTDFIEDENKEEQDKKTTWLVKNGRFSLYEITVYRLSNHFTDAYVEVVQDELKKKNLNTGALQFQISNWIINSCDEYLKSAKVRKYIRDEGEKLYNLDKQDVEADSIKDWIKNEGKKENDYDKKKFAPKFINEFKEKYITVKKNADKTKQESTKRAESIRHKYKSLKTLEEKLDYLLEAGAYTNSLADMEDTRFEIDSDMVYKLMVEFCNDYMANADFKTIKRTLTHLGKIKADVILGLMDEEKRYGQKIALNDPQRDKKIRYLVRGDKEGVLFSALTGIVHYATDILARNQNLKQTFREAFAFNENSTMKDIADMLGYTQEQANVFYSKYGVFSYSKVLDGFKDYYTNRYPKPLSMDDDVEVEEEVSDKRLRDFINDEIRNLAFDQCMDAGRDAKIKEVKLPKERMEDYNAAVAHSVKERSPSHIEDWINGEGKELVAETDKGALKLVNEYEARYNKEVSFDNYIRLHIGINAVESPLEVQNDYLAKAVAANLLKKTDGKFDLDKIHVMAENVKNMPEYMKVIADPKTVLEALKSRKNIDAMTERMTNSVYKITSANAVDYVNDMNKLYKSLMSDKGRTAEYKAFYSAVKKIAGLADRYDFNHEYDRKAAVKDIVELNAKLLDSVKKYMKGKKAVRWTDNGKERFNNALDALGVMVKHIPGAESQIQKVVGRINDVRWERNAVDLKQFGAERAENAKAKRDAKQPTKNAAKVKM